VVGPSFSHELLGWLEVGCGLVLGSTSMAAAMVGGGMVADNLLIRESGRDGGSQSVSSAFHLAMAHGIPPGNPRTHNCNTERQRQRQREELGKEERGSYRHLASGGEDDQSRRRRPDLNRGCRRGPIRTTWMTY
jgi:hypothetical protein